MENIKHYTIPLQESVMLLLMRITGTKTAKAALEAAVLRVIRGKEKQEKEE